MKSGVAPPRPLPRRPSGPGRPGRSGLRLLRSRAGPQVRQDLPGLLPALPAGRLRRGREVRPERHAQLSTHQPEARRRFRLRLHHPAHDDQPVRPGGGAAIGGEDAVEDDAEQARHPDPRLRPDRCRRVPPRLQRQGAVHLARHARPLRRHQDRPDRHSRRRTRWPTSRTCLPLRLRASRTRGPPRRLRRRHGSSPTFA